MSNSTPDYFQPNSKLEVKYESYPFISPQRFAGKLKGKVVIVTGASSGIGKASCLAFAAAGASVACVARRRERLEELVATIKEKFGSPVTAVVADVSEPAAAKRILSQVERELGPVDVVLNNAGIPRVSPVAAEEDLMATWWRVIQVNLLGPVALIHAALPSMIERKAGVLITVSSAAAVVDLPCMTAYGTSKAAVSKFHQSLHSEVSGHGIQSFSVHPGTVQTEIASADGGINMKALESEPAMQGMLKAFQAKTDYQSLELAADTFVALVADERCKVLSGCYIDAEQDIGVVVEEAEKAGGGRVAKERLYKLKVDEL